MQRLFSRTWTTLTLAAAALSACGADGGPSATPDDGAGADTSVPVEATPCASATNADGEPVACISGRLVDAAGAPVAGVKVSACTLQTCIVGQTKDDGRYLINKVPVEPHKVEVLGQIRGYATMVFYQSTVAGMLTTPSRDIVVFTVDDAASSWLPTDGGVVSLAGGMLELSAPPGALRYPLGTVDKEVVAVEIAAEDLPPFDISPWEGKVAATRAFIVNPFPVTAEVALGLVVHGATDVAAGAAYDVYAADHLSALLEHVGTATADGQGSITGDPGGALTTLSTLILVPQG